MQEVANESSSSAREEFPTLPETPSKPAKLPAAAPTTPVQRPAAHSHHLRASPRPRRQLGEKLTPRSSRLSTEVFSAADESDESGEEDFQETEAMEVDN